MTLSKDRPRLREAIFFAAMLSTAVLSAAGASETSLEEASRPTTTMFDNTCLATSANYDKSLIAIMSSNIGWKEVPWSKAGGEVRGRRFVAGSPTMPFAAAVIEAELPEFSQAIGDCIVAGPALTAQVDAYFSNMGARPQKDRWTATDHYYQILIDGNFIQLSSSFKGSQFVMLHATDYPDDAKPMWLAD